MRKLSVALMMLVGFTSVCFAQEAAPAVANAAPQQAEIKTIFSFQKELGLTDKQVADIKEQMTNLKNELMLKTEEIKGLREDLSKMVAAREDIKKIRKLLQKIADIQVDNTCLDLETSRKVEAAVTSEQWASWKAIQEKSREEAIAKAKAAQEAAQPKK